MAVINIFEEKSTKEIVNLKETVSKETLKNRAEILALIYNNAVQGGDYAPSIEIIDESGEVKNVLVREVMEATVNNYTHMARNECFETLRTTEDPMLEAIKLLEYSTIRITDKKIDAELSTGETVKLPVTSIDDTSKYIDLKRLQEYVHKKDGISIGKNSNWSHMIEKLNFLMTARVCKELKTDPKELNSSYAMSDIAKQLDIGQNVTSNTNLLKSLQKVVNAMIGEEYHALSHDVNFLNRVYSRKSRKALSVVCANHRYMTQYIMEICHRIVMGEVGYSTEFKKKTNASK